MRGGNKVSKKQLSNQRCYGLDILKTLCAFMVVCIHIPFFGGMVIIDQYIKNLSRIAVPIFFMITGFFYYDTVNANRETKQIKKILYIFIYANLLFFIFNMLIGVVKGDFVGEVKQLINVHTLLQFVFFNVSPFSSHLWYLGAVLYVLLIVYFVNRCRNSIKILYILTPFLLMADLIFGKYSLIFLKRDITHVFLVRNFLFVGLPYFCVGSIIRSINDKGRLTIKRGFLLILIILFSVTSILEMHLLTLYNLSATREHYISTTFLSICVFVYFLLYFPHSNISCVGNKIAYIGKNCSAGIYIIHPMFVNIVLFLERYLKFLCWFGPIVVFILSLITVVLYKFFIKNIRNNIKAVNSI